MTLKRFVWTDDSFEQAKAWFLAGRSATEIAREMHPDLTRSAVLGKFFRKGIQRPRPAAPAKKPKAPKAVKEPNNFGSGFKRPKLKTVVVGNGAVILVGPSPAPREQARDVAAFVAHAPRVWTSRKRGECAFPVGGSGADTLSCCNPTKGATYCATHAAVMAGNMPKSWAGFSTPRFARAVA